MTLSIFESLLQVGESNGKKRDSTDLYLIFGSTSERDEGLVFLQGKQKKTWKKEGGYTHLSD